MPIAPSTYYAHRAAPVSQADWDDAHMANSAFEVWRANRSLYGADKLATVMREGRLRPALSFTEALLDAGIAPSVGTVGDAL